MSNQATSNAPADERPRMGMGGRPGGPGRPAKIEKAHNPRRALSRLVPYLTAFKFGLILVMFFVLIYTLLGLVGPYLMGKAIDPHHLVNPEVYKRKMAR